MLKEDKLNLILRFCFLALFSFSIIGLSGCGTVSGFVGRIFGPEKPDDPGFGNQAEFVDYKDGQPLIRAGITLRLGVTASGAAAVPDALKEVDLSGKILLPFIDAVKCEGLTVLELQDEITERYKKFFIDPQVTVNFVYQPGLKSPWGTVLMTGEVAKFGPVDMPSTRDLTVTRALMMAGGATPLANKKKVLVWRREKSGDLKKFEVDIDAIGQKGDRKQDIKLVSGDVVFVPESWY
jgi:protein involved in polysaccharide export with SLBB domain